MQAKILDVLKCQLNITTITKKSCTPEICCENDSTCKIGLKFIEEICVPPCHLATMLSVEEFDVIPDEIKQNFFSEEEIEDHKIQKEEQRKTLFNK